MSKTRDSFVQNFGETEAKNIEKAANEHAAEFIYDQNRGSDLFRWAICICIGFECMELAHYRDYHDIVTPWETLQTWIKEHGDLQNHDGDVDTAAFGAGAYEEYDLSVTISPEQISTATIKTTLGILSKLSEIGKDSN